MKTIKRTYESALEAAKSEIISKFESYHDTEIGLESEISISNDDSLWLIRNTTCQCGCGQTSAIEVILFEKEMDDSEHFNGEWGTNFEDNQFNTIIGICENCGE